MDTFGNVARRLPLKFFGAIMVATFMIYQVSNAVILVEVLDILLNYFMFLTLFVYIHFSLPFCFLVFL